MQPPKQPLHQLALSLSKPSFLSLSSLAMDTAEWAQGIGVAEKKARPGKEEALNCPRCSSTNTKFCYYNNYSLSQPRYFCKTCRRYWTNGGALRNVPVGGASRKNKRSSSSSLSRKALLPDLHHAAEMASFPVAELFRAGNVGCSAWMTSSAPVPEVSAAGFGFSGHYGNNININVDINRHQQQDHHHHEDANSSRILFPFEELKPVLHHHNGEFEERESGSNYGFWSGMINGGSSW